MTKFSKSSLVSILLYLGYINCIWATCPECLDLVLIVDRSASIGNSENWMTDVLPFLQKFSTTGLWNFGSAANQYQAAIVTYGSDATLEWNFNSSYARYATDYIYGLSTIERPQFALTSPYQGLVTAKDDVLLGPRNRPSCLDTCIVLIQEDITKDTALFYSYVGTFKEACQKIIAVGVDTERSILEALVNDPLHIVEFSSLGELSAAFPAVAAIVCMAESPATERIAEPSSNENMGETTGYKCPHTSPCSPLVTAGQYYYPHMNENMYVACDAFGGCFNKHCGGNLKWRVAIGACAN